MIKQSPQAERHRNILVWAFCVSVGPAGCSEQPLQCRSAGSWVWASRVPWDPLFHWALYYDFPRVLPTELCLHRLCFYCLPCLCYQGQLEFKNQVDFVIDGDLGASSGRLVDVARLMSSSLGAWQWVWSGGWHCFRSRSAWGSNDRLPGVGLGEVGGDQEPQAVDGAAVPGSLWARAHKYSWRHPSPPSWDCFVSWSDSPPPWVKLRCELNGYILSVGPPEETAWYSGNKETSDGLVSHFDQFCRGTMEVHYTVRV